MPALRNAKWEMFAQEIAKGETTEKAYAKVGYVEDHANSWRLRARPEIKARVQELIEAGAEQAEVTIGRVISELAKIGFSDIRSLFNENGALKRIEDLGDDAAAALSSVEVVTRRLPGGEDAEVEHVAKIKLWDKRAALVDLGKHLGMFADRVELTGKNGGPIETADVSDIEAARRVAFVLTKGAREQQRPN